MKLTPKERKFVNSKVKGNTNRQAYKDAYNVRTKKISTVDRNATKIARKDHVQQAIAEALDKAELTPEYAIQKLKEIVDQNKEIGAKRLAIKDVLELHGYKGNRDRNVQLNVAQGFFKVSRDEQ